MLHNYLINPITNLCRHIKISKRVKNKGIEFTVQKLVDDILDYAKVPVMIQSYANFQSYAKATGTPSDPKDTRCNRRRDAAAATSSTSE